MKLRVHPDSMFHVKTCFNEARLDKWKSEAQIRYYKRLRKDGCFAMIYLRPGTPLNIVVHEITHAAVFYVRFYTKARNFLHTEEYARAAECMFCDYMNDEK